MSRKLHTYRVTLPDGSTATRETANIYTHMVAVRKGAEWSGLSFHYSKSGAQQGVQRASRWGSPPDETRILPVPPIEEATR